MGLGKPDYVGHDDGSLFPRPALIDGFAQRGRADLERREEALVERERQGEADALACISDLALPEDVKRLGEKMGCPALAEFVWRAGFAAGWNGRGRR